ncbi:MAG: HSP90 family protein [Lachnospiraceae bacterium]|nr:HSP90 family protein [Lachnospiraceae bacterium]
MEDFRFKVNLGGMIEILSDHLYSSPDVYIRELLQNAVDAITGRKKLQSDSPQGAITLEIEEGRRLIFTDNGQGLTEEEIHQFLAIIGESSKRELTDRNLRTDYIGRFGIGLLSCFMVSDEIRMITKSCRSKEAPVLEWRGKPDGTYTIETLPHTEEKGQEEETEWLASPGTKVILRAKPEMDEYFTRETIEHLLTYYGLLLPFPITIQQQGRQQQINPAYLPWEGRRTNKQELLLFGQMIFGEQFLDCVTFQSEEGNVSGVAYILNYTVLPSAKSNHRIYLKHMLLTEKGDNLIPDWAVFTKCIVHTTDLRPTASREGFYVDGMLESAREAIENALMEYIDALAGEEPELFGRFFQIHHLTLMSLALSDSKLFETLIDYFEFETTRGTMTGYDLRVSSEPLVYAPTREKYKQLSQLFFAQDRLLINVSYVHALDLLEQLGKVFDRKVSPVEEWEVEDLMQDLSPEDQDKGFDFLTKANRILQSHDCRAELKAFSPAHQPTFYLIDENTVISRQIASSRSQADAMFFHMLDAFAEDFSTSTAATLYFNYLNPIVKKLVEIESEDMLKVFLEILYVQALQIGGFSLHNNEMSMLNRNILLLMERGLTDV